jgi:hypothetical protein
MTILLFVGLLAAVTQIAFVLQPGHKETRWGSGHFGADTPDVLPGHLEDGLWFHLLKFGHPVALRGDDYNLVPQPPLLQEDRRERYSYADDLSRGITIFLGKGQHVFS